MIDNYNDLKYIRSLSNDLVLGTESLSLLEFNNNLYLRYWLDFYDGNHYTISRITKEDLDLLLNNKLEVKSAILNSDELYYCYEPLGKLETFIPDPEFIEEFLPKCGIYYEDISGE